VGCVLGAGKLGNPVTIPPPTKKKPSRFLHREEAPQRVKRKSQKKQHETIGGWGKREVRKEAKAKGPNEAKQTTDLLP
jgi:hypothetical protein